MPNRQNLSSRDTRLRFFGRIACLPCLRITLLTMRTLLFILEKLGIALFAAFLLLFALHVAGAVVVLYHKLNLNYFERL
jgi:hypothetical protein